jgi:hypothetical protein
MFLVGKPEGKRSLGRLRCRWEEGENGFKGDWLGGWSGFIWLRIGSDTGLL